MKLYHGTTKSAYEAIMKNGFDNNGKTNWYASYNDTTYFWNPMQLLESGEADDLEQATDLAVSRAFESAQIAAAASMNCDPDLVVIEYDYPDTEDAPEVDESCDNMAYGACEIVGADNNRITGYYTSPNFPQLHVFILIGILDNEHFRKDLLDHGLVRVLERLKGRDLFFDELLEFYPVYSKVELRSAA